MSPKTKLDVISDFNIMQILGAGFDYFFSPSYPDSGWDFGRLAVVGLVYVEHIRSAILSLGHGSSCFQGSRVVVVISVWSSQGL
jgi:hypothetical protein